MNEKILDKLRKLMRHQASAAEIGSEAEAQAFAEKIQQLMIEHEIEMSEIRMDEVEGPKDEIGDSSFHPRDKGYTSRANRLWLRVLARAVSSGHLCKLMVSTNDNAVWFVGRAANREVAIFMYEYLIRAAMNLVEIKYAENWRRESKHGDVRNLRGFKASFLENFAYEISRRYDEKLRSQSSSTALILASAMEGMQKYVDARTSGRSANRLNSRGDNAIGTLEGRAAARSINLSPNPIKAGGGPKGSLR